MYSPDKTLFVRSIRKKKSWRFKGKVCFKQASEVIPPAQNPNTLHESSYLTSPEDIFSAIQSSDKGGPQNVLNFY